MPNSNSRSGRVLIRTLPLSNANYGGILQAYALQETLRDLGYHPATDLSVSHELGTLLSRVARACLKIVPASMTLPRRAEGFRRDLEGRMLNAELGKSLMPFVESHLQTVRLYKPFGRIDREVLDDFGKFVAGSDQVWRRAYGDVTSYLFDFLEGAAPTVISYAASFGRDDLSEYDDALLAETRRLAGSFSSISVRESSAVGLCEKFWNVDAEHHVDPTLLLASERYTDLLADMSPFSSSPFCLSYVLDESLLTKMVVGRVADSLGLPEEHLLRRPASYREWRADPAKYPLPSVERWLQAFSSADYVVTDSFHGTVFSILYNRPFVSVVNNDRGLARFESLLGMFGLEDRLICSDSDKVDSVAGSPIDWRSINIKIAEENWRGREYLERSLSGE